MPELVERITPVEHGRRAFLSEKNYPHRKDNSERYPAKTIRA